MHLAGAFGIPSVTVLGEWYDSAQLHQRQWGYPEGLVLGKETSNGMPNLFEPEDVFKIYKKHANENHPRSL